MSAIAYPTPRRASFAENFRAARGALLAFWLFSLVGAVILPGFIVLYEGLHGDIWILFVAIGAGIVGMGVGNVLGLLQLRPWISVVASLVLGPIVLFGSAATGLEVLAISALLFFMALPCGHFALEHRLDLAAAWWPVLLWVGTIVLILNEHGRVVEWEHNKVGAWMPVPLILLFLMIVFLFVFLLTKENHHLTVWRSLGAGAAARLRVGPTQAQRIRLSPRGWVALLILAAAVFSATAFLAPYLWRTGRGDKPRGERQGEPRRPLKPDVNWDKIADAIRDAARRAVRDSSSLLPFVPLFLLNRPIRRAFLLRHLRRPFYPVSPSRRVANLWRYVRIGLDDAGIAPKPAESVGETVDRVDKELQKRGRPSPEGLAEAGTIYRRVRYGLGMDKADVERLGVHAAVAYRNVRADMTVWEHIKCWWRKLE